MNYKDIVALATKFKTYVEKHHKFPKEMEYNGKKYNYGTIAYYFTEFIRLNGKKVTDKTIKNNTSNTKTSINEKITEKDYRDQCKRISQFISKNGKIPSTVATVKSKKTVIPSDYIYAFSKIIVFYAGHTRFPATCLYDSSIYNTKSTPKKDKTTVKSNEVYEYFVKTFGKITDFDSALTKIKGKGYGYYYNDKLSNKQVIHNLKKGGQKPNCTDISQMLWHIAKALGYEVKAVHMQCKSGGGHIYLKLKHPKNTKDKWITRDGACVISDNGKPITCVWCSNGTLIDVNPSWFKETLNK